MYLFRYLQPPGTLLPVAMLEPVPGATMGTVSILGNRERGQVVLRKPADCAVAQIEGEVALALTVFLPPGFPEQQIPIELTRLDTLSGAAPEVIDRPPVDTPLAFLGHIEMRGDVQGAPGDWLGTPGSRARLEGFVVSPAGVPAGLELTYSCVVRGFGRTPEARCGEFVGTRQKAAPIIGVSFRLLGENADKYILDIQAAFARAGAVKVAAGQMVGGLDPEDYLTGLRGVLRPKAAGPNTIIGKPDNFQTYLAK